MDDQEVLDFVTDVWDKDIIPTLHDYIRIPNVSPVFEEDWAELGHMRRAVDLLADWARARPIPGLTLEVHEIDGLTPVILMEIPPANGGSADDTVLLYGHLDKQPELFGWRDGLGPWEPVIEGDRLYGRGGADDGYSTFASLACIEAAQAAGFPHTRLVVLIEASEESGSRDLPAHIDALSARIGKPSLVICLDSGCADYDHLWITTSLRGLLAGELERRRAVGGRALGRRQRSRAVDVPDRPPDPLADRGRERPARSCSTTSRSRSRRAGSPSSRARRKCSRRRSPR